MKTSHLVIGFCFVLSFNGCKRNDAIVPESGGSQETAISSPFYFKATINGENVLIQDGLDGYVSGADELGGNAPGAWEEDQGMVITRFLNPENSAGVYIIKNFIESPGDCSEIEEMFHEGEYPFGKISDGSESGTEGVAITYMDRDGRVWASYLGEGAQHNSHFRIIDHTLNTDSTSQRITKAVFSCTLYDEDGHSRKLTNGEIRCRSVQCNGI